MASGTHRIIPINVGGTTARITPVLVNYMSLNLGATTAAAEFKFGNGAMVFLARNGSAYVAHIGQDGAVTVITNTLNTVSITIGSLGTDNMRTASISNSANVFCQGFVMGN